MMYQPMTDENTISLNQLTRRGHKFTHTHEAAQLHLGCLVCRTDQTDQVEKFTIQG